MAEQSSEKPPAAALTDPILDAGRFLRPDVDIGSVTKIDTSALANYHESIGNPYGVTANSNVEVDKGEFFRQVPSYLKTAGAVLQPVVHKLEKDTIKAGILELIKKSGVIGGRAMAAAKVGLSSSVSASGINPLKFAKGLVKSQVLKSAELESVGTALNTSEIVAAFANKTHQLHEFEHGLTKVGLYGAAVLAPVTMGNAELPKPTPEQIKKMDVEYYEQPSVLALMENKQNAELAQMESRFGVNSKMRQAFERASFETWSENEDKRYKESLEKQIELTKQNAFNKISDTGYRPDHVSAYFSKVS